MRLVAVAFVTGLCLAAGILGVQLEDATGAHAPDVQPRVEEGHEPAGRWPTSSRQALAASHSDANTEGNAVYLNGRLIRGEPTVLCTTSDAVLTQLRLAVQRWNDALSGALPHGDDTGPFGIHPRTGSAPSSCAYNLPTLDIDVVVVYERTSGSSVYDSKKSDPGQLPRKQFETDNESAYLNTEHATLVLRDPNEIKVSTIVHELGHVLGLSDYESCEPLRGRGSAHIRGETSDRVCGPTTRGAVAAADRLQSVVARIGGDSCPDDMIQT